MHEATGAVDNGKVGKARRLYTNRFAEAWERSRAAFGPDAPAGCGVLTLSRGELVRLSSEKDHVFNGLWLSERRVSEELEALDPVADKRPCRLIDTFFANTDVYPSVVRYRVEGQKKPAQAIVAAPSVEAGKVALSALLGKAVVAYVVEQVEQAEEAQVIEQSLPVAEVQPAPATTPQPVAVPASALMPPMEGGFIAPLRVKPGPEPVAPPVMVPLPPLVNGFLAPPRAVTVQTSASVQGVMFTAKKPAPPPQFPWETAQAQSEAAEEARRRLHRPWEPDFARIRQAAAEARRNGTS